MHATLWLLLLPAFCECLVLIGIHSYLGIHVIKRKVIFVDLALAQIAALGTLVAFLFGIPLHTTAAYFFALGFTAVAAAIFALCRFREGKIPQEAIIGLTYAIAAAIAILLIDKAPHGAEHIKEIMTGSILWVKWPSIGVAAVVYCLVGLVHYRFRDKFILISEDPAAAWEAGLNVRFWDFVFYLLFGIVITLSVDTAGVLIVFVFLVAPAIIAMLITDSLARQVIVGWALGVVVTTAGLALSYTADLPTGPSIIGAYGVTLVLIAAVLYNIRAADRMQALTKTGIVCGGFVLLFGLLFGIGKALGAYARHHRHRMPVAPVAAQPEAAQDRPLSRITEIQTLKGLYRGTPETAGRAEIVCRALEIDEKAGILLALQFLKQDPPLFFRQSVVEQLNARLQGAAAFDIEKPFSAASNQKALRHLLRKYALDARAVDNP